MSLDAKDLPPSVLFSSKVTLPLSSVRPLRAIMKTQTDGRKKLIIQVPSCNPTSNRKTLLIETASGWIGGSVGIALTHPIDSIRVSKQYQSRISSMNMSYYQILKHIKQTHGFSGFYRGLLPPTVLRGGCLAANRCGYNLGMRAFDEGVDVKGTWRIWIVGCLAGLCTGIVDLPIQLLKCRAQVKAGLTKETFSLYALMLKRIWRFEGISAFFNGGVPHIAGSMFSYGIFYYLYEQMVLNGCSVFMAGVLAGTFSWPLILPLDSLRVRMQCQPYDVRLSTVAAEMWRQPIRQWFSGLGATMLRAAPRWGATMMAIEECNRVMRERL